MSWCSKWIHGSEWPEGVEVTLGHDGNVRRYVPESENSKLRELAGALLTSHEKMCTQRGHCFGCMFFYEEVKACPYVKISRMLRELGIEVDE